MGQQDGWLLGSADVAAQMARDSGTDKCAVYEYDDYVCEWYHVATYKVEK